MKKKGNNKGITLIALVITIIIMIILVAVSVALAVKGDLFGNAQEGTDKTRIEAEKEQLTEYVYGQYKENIDGKVEVNLEEVKDILNADKEKFNGDAKIDGDKLTVTGVSGEIYIVNTKGKIEDLKENKKETSINNTYCLYNTDYYNTYKLILNEDNTVSGNWIEYYCGEPGAEIKNANWSEEGNNIIKIVGDINRDGEEYSEYIFFRIAKVNNGIVLCSNGGGIYISDLDIINSFVYLDNGKYVWKYNDPNEEWAKTISYKIVDGYKFGIWTDPDDSNTYFTDGSFVVNPFGDFYTIDEKGQLIDEDGDILVYKGN